MSAELRDRLTNAELAAMHEPLHIWRCDGLIQLHPAGRFKDDPAIMGSYTSFDVYWTPFVREGDYCNV
jgi:hypothetical protein